MPVSVFLRRVAALVRNIRIVRPGSFPMELRLGCYPRFCLAKESKHVMMSYVFTRPPLVILITCSMRHITRSAVFHAVESRKVKAAKYLTCHENARGSRGIAPCILILGTRCRRVVSITHLPVYLQFSIPVG